MTTAADDAMVLAIEKFSVSLDGRIVVTIEREPGTADEWFVGPVARGIDGMPQVPYLSILGYVAAQRVAGELAQAIHAFCASRDANAETFRQRVREIAAAVPSPSPQADPR